MKPSFYIPLFALGVLLIAGCATPVRLAAVPVQDTTRAEIPGIPNARYWVDADIEPFLTTQRDGLGRPASITGDSESISPKCVGTVLA